jgi:hypothetical protein
LFELLCIRVHSIAKRLRPIWINLVHQGPSHTPAGKCTLTIRNLPKYSGRPMIAQLTVLSAEAKNKLLWNTRLL